MEGENMKLALREVGKLIKAKLRQGAKDKGHKATGKLDKSFKYRVVANELTIFAEQYAGAISKGVKKDPNYSKTSEDFANSIIQWAKAKGIRPNRDKKGRFASYKSMAMAMAVSIRRKGISKRFGYEGSGFIDAVKKNTKKEIKTILKTAYKKDILQQLDELKTIK
jgi:hypothetical protein